MSAREEPIFHIVDYILNEASDGELQAIMEAVRKRGKRGPLQQMNFSDMAQKMTSQLNMGQPDIHGMAKRMVRGLILQQQPDIPPAHLDALLEHYVPDPQKAEAQREAAVPPNILQSMMRQFVAYSIGAMPQSEERELRAAMPNWPETYWKTFSEKTRSVIKELIAEARGR